MPTLQIIITDAGRQAIVDETNAGTLPVTISEVAVGTGRWVPDATTIALQTELKRINTVGGIAVAADTIHVTITDESVDTYSLGEFGLYTDSGILFAIYSDVNGIMDKAADALLLISSDIVLTSVPPGAVTVNGVGFSNPAASETLAGIAELATQTETNTGTDDARVVTPKKLMGAAASAATANTLMRRDANGRAKVAAPSASDDIARKDTVDTVQTNLNTHAAQTTPHSATSAATANRLMLRDVSGRAKVSAPSAGDDIARKDTVDAVIPAGTRMLFMQPAAPTGWTKNVVHDNTAIRIVSGATGGAAGGTVAFSTAFKNRTVSSTTASGTVGNTTLSITQIPVHGHSITSGNSVVGGGAANFIGGQTFAAYQSTGLNGGGGTHTHAFAGVAHDHTLDMAVKYVDAIIASKN